MNKKKRIVIVLAIVLASIAAKEWIRRKGWIKLN